MEKFIDFLLTKVYRPVPIPESIIDAALKVTIQDFNYHFPKLIKEDVVNLIQNNSNELAVFLFRVGSELHRSGFEEQKPQIHWLLKELCGCEIYFNNDIDKGFYIIHGEGTVIGSRNSIGKGFKIHQGCTIGHKRNNSKKEGVKIGDNVTLYCNSSVLGNIAIGNNVIIGAHILLSKSIPNDKIIVSNQNFVIKG